MNTGHTKFDRSKYLRLSELGSRFNLSFSSHLTLGEKIIALDGIHKKLLISEMENGSEQAYVVELDKIKAISLKKNYKNIQAGELRKKKFEEFMQSIYLLFEYGDERKTISLPFYERERDKFQDLQMLERNARNWQMILSKMITLKRTKKPEKKEKQYRSDN